MTIEVHANDFCPDECPYCELEMITETVMGEGLKRTCYCKNTELCLHAIRENKIMEADNG